MFLWEIAEKVLDFLKTWKGKFLSAKVAETTFAGNATKSAEEYAHTASADFWESAETKKIGLTVLSASLVYL